MLQKGGRPKKRVRTGRPPSVSPRYCAQYVREIAPPPLVEPATTISICEAHQAIDTSQLHCPICFGVLLSPIELVTYGSLVCAQCCCKWLNHCTCPCCYHPHITDFSTIRPASPLILSTLGRLCVVCEKCDHHLRLDKLKEHLASSCSTYSPASSPESIEQILSQPISTPLTPLEHKLQTSLVKHSLSTSSAEKVLRLRTRGQVSNKYSGVIDKYTYNGE
jgi:hypothetical protein